MWSFDFFLFFHLAQIKEKGELSSSIILYNRERIH